MEMGKKLIRSSLFRTGNFVVQILISFVMIPVIVHSLGDRLYGFWTMVAVFIGYYGLLDLGLSSAVGRFVSRAVGKDEPEEINEVVNTSFFLYTVIGVIVLIISLVAVIFCFYFLKNPEEISLFRKIIIILGISSAIGFPMRVFPGVLNSFLRYDLAAFSSITRLLISNALIYYFLKSGYGILSLAVIVFCGSFLEHAMNFFFSLKTFPHLEISYSHFEKDKVKSLFEYSGKTFVAQLGDHLRFKVDSFVIAGFLNLSLVTYYAIGAKIMEIFVQFISRSVGIMLPVFSQYEGKGDFESIRIKFLEATKISVIISVFTGLSIIYYGKSFIKLWMGPGFESSYYVILILCVPFITALMQNPTIGLLYGTSRHHFYAISNVSEGILNLILSLILVKRYGIYGVAMGTAISMIIFKLCIQPIYTCISIKLSIFDYYFRTLFLTTIKTVIPLLCYFYVARNYLREEYFIILLSGFFQGILFLPIAYFFVLGKSERQSIMRATGLNF